MSGALVGAISYRQYSQSKVTSVPTNPIPANVFTNPDNTQASQLRKAATAAVTQRIQKRKQRILAQAREAGRITNDGVEDLFCISDRTASEYLRQLTSEGHLTRQGDGRGTFYIPKKP